MTFRRFLLQYGKIFRNVPMTAATPDAPKGQKKGPGFLTHSAYVLTHSVERVGKENLADQ